MGLLPLRVIFCREWLWLCQLRTWEHSTGDVQIAALGKGRWCPALLHESLHPWAQRCFLWVLAWFHSSTPAMWPQHHPVPAPCPQPAHQGARAPRWASQQQAVTSATGLPHVLMTTCRWFMCSQCKLQSQCNFMGINLWTPIPCPLPQIVSLSFFFLSSSIPCPHPPVHCLESLQWAVCAFLAVGINRRQLSI